MEHTSIDHFHKMLAEEKKNPLLDILRQLTTVSANSFEKDKGVGPAPLGAWGAWG